MICDTCKYLNTNHNEHPCYECLNACAASKYEAIESEDTMTDFIDRNKVLETIFNIMSDDKIVHKHRALNRNIQQIPKADTERHAHWIRYEHNSGIHCSKCNHKARYKDIHRFEYCPHCGRKMDEVMNNE